MYAEFYRLSGEPFLLTPDERFYFESSVHAQAMAHLTYGVECGEGFIVITGDVGAGKTTLVRRLLATVDRDRFVAAHVVSTMLEGADLLRIVGAAFGMRNLPRDKSALLVQLFRLFQAIAKADKRALLIVDEAQNLSATALEELRMLSNFQAGNGAPIQSFLLGQPEFRRTISSPELEQLRQRVIASYHLGPMNREETGAYLVHRLTQVGWSQDPTFDEGAVAALFAASGGIPRRINTLCSRLMLHGFLDELHHFGRAEVELIAADLAREGMTATVPAPDAEAADLDPAQAGGLTARLSRLERAAARQEKALGRIAQALQEYLQAGGAPEFAGRPPVEPAGSATVVELGGAHERPDTAVA